MRLSEPRSMRSTLFLGCVVLWLAAFCLVALPRLFLSGLTAQVTSAELALAADPTPLLARSIGMNAEMVRAIEADAAGTGLLALYSPGQNDLLTQQVYRCQQFFYPRMVVGWRSSQQAARALEVEGLVFVLDYSAASDHPFTDGFSLASEFGVLRMWVRMESK